MTSPDASEAEEVRTTLINLTKIIREMTPMGAKPVPETPHHFNLLARPHAQAALCRICGLIGHHSTNVNASEDCRTAILSLIGFWEDVAENVKFLYRASSRFNKTIAASEPTYDMRLDTSPPKGGDMEKVIVDGLTRNYLKFQAHYSRIRAKANIILSAADLALYEEVSDALNDFLLRGQTLSDLYERSIEEEKVKDDEDVEKEVEQE